MVQDTSAKAYKEVIEPNLSNLCDKVYNALVEVGPMTQEELHEYCSQRYGEVVWSTYRSRIADLQKKGLVERAGKRHCDNGREHIVWRAAPRGTSPKAAETKKQSPRSMMANALKRVYEQSACSWSKTVAYHALKEANLLKVLQG